MSDNNNINEENPFNDPFNTEVRDETDLTGMDLDSAKEYVVSYITSLKQLQGTISSVIEEHTLWKGRVQFAEERNRADLKAAADMKFQEMEEKLLRLQTEEKDLARKVSTLMENLKKLKAGFTFSIDADRLLAELEMIVGEKDEVAEKFKEEETLAELEKLKKRMKEEAGEE